MSAINRSDLFKDAQFFQTPEGLLIGTLVLLLFWVLLRVLEAVQKPSWAIVTRSVRRPLVFGFGVALYTGWLFGLLANNVEILTDRNVAQLTTSIVLLVFGRAVNVAFLNFCIPSF